jgi:glycosyltransferase involved in cell wall biosynthesis
VRIRLFTWHDPSEGVAFKALQRRGFEVSVAKLGDTPSSVRWLLSEMLPEPPDLFVANHVVPGYYAAKYLKQSGIPSIGVLRSDAPFYWGLSDNFVLGRSKDRIAGLVCVSDYLRQRVLERRPESVEVRRIASGTPMPSETSPPPGETLRIAYVGRLVEEQKRASEMALALARATKEVHGVEAVLFGDGPARTEVERILAQAGAKSVRLAGPIESEEIQKRLLDCQVIVLLSDYEGTPIAVMEGMACGCVPVCLRIRSGIPELVEDGVTGLLVDDRAEGFVTAIRRLRHEAGLWERLSRAARARIASDFSIEACAAQWAELLHCLRDKSGSKRGIQIPRRLKLPPPHPSFGGEDPRPFRPPPLVHWYRRSRMAAGRWRRRLFKYI